MYALLMAALGASLWAVPPVAMPAVSTGVSSPTAVPITTSRVALMAPAATNVVSKAVLRKALQAAQDEFRAQGYQTISPAQVNAAYWKKKRRAPPSCADDPGCLATVGKIADAHYVLNLSVSRTGKTYGVKLTLVDVAMAKTVSNIMGLLAKPQPNLVVDAVKQKLPRATSALGKYIAEKQATVFSSLLPAAPPEPTVAPMAPATNQPADQSAASSPSTPSVPPVPLDTTAASSSSVAPRLLPSSVPESSGEETRSHASRKSTLVPWLMVGAGAAAVGAGVGIFGVQARSAVDDYRAGRDAAAARDRAKSKAIWCDVTVGAGAALLVGGAAMLIFSGDSSAAHADSVRTTVNILPDSGWEVAISGGF